MKKLKKLILITLVAATILMTASVSMAKSSNVPESAEGNQVITFAELGRDTQTMLSPYDTYSLLLGVPSNWVLTSGAEIVLDMQSIVIGDNAATFSDLGNSTAGLVEVRFNDVLLQSIPITNFTGQVHVPITGAALASVRDDGRHTLDLILLADASCDFNYHTSVVINQDSYFYFPYDTTEPNLDLAQFPRPVYQRSSFIQDNTILVIPDEPTQEEVQAAITVAAALGKTSNGDLPLQTVVASNLNSSPYMESNLIFVGLPGSFSNLTSSGLRLPSNADSFYDAGSQPDDGVIEFSSSPWNTSNTMILVSGDSATAILKAAQALTGDQIITYEGQTTAFVKTVDATAGGGVPVVDRTLADLGYVTYTRSNIGTNTFTYDFYIAPSQINDQESYVTVNFSHSGVVDFNNSSLSVFLNGTPVGSIPLSEESAGGDSRQVRLPKELMLVGDNSVSVQAAIAPENLCDEFILENIWFTVFDSTSIHLPIGTSESSTARVFDLAAFPGNLLVNPTMNDLVFVVDPTAPASWAAAAQVAFYLGDQSRGEIFTPHVVFDTGQDYADIAFNDLVIVGLPSQMPIVNTISGGMPIRFEPGTNDAVEEGFKVVYRALPGTDVGYITLLTSPWAPDRMILTLLGSSDTGVGLSAETLSTSALRADAVGNVAVTNGRQVSSADTRIIRASDSVLATAVPVSAESGETAPPPISGTPTLAKPLPGWVLALVIIVSVIIAIVVLAIVFAPAKNGTRKSQKEFKDFLTSQKRLENGFEEDAVDQEPEENEEE